MVSARTTCPQCHGSSIVDLADLLFSRTVDFFRCSSCGCWWSVLKGQDGPAMPGILSEPNASALSNQAKAG